MGKEKVEVLGMMFDKGTEPKIQYLQRNKDGVFYGPSYEYVENDLRAIMPYLEGGEIFIDFENVIVFVFLKYDDMCVWQGKDAYILGWRY